MADRPQHLELINRPHKDEIPFCKWKEQVAEYLKISVGRVNNMLSEKKLKYPPVRRVNKRVIFVKLYDQQNTNKANTSP